ncbi:helix-turn-helix transcriptional regulator [Pseudomonas paraeruginosa]|uniref:helix-turn-helix transcriptional regulator n=1 Tax=Pseudomonas paraeruginosa TaxID=2994495 RepID=UPI00053DAF22|nr:AlpA family phage regulatory protein [Pseudomonas paraeruginosa]
MSQKTLDRLIKIEEVMHQIGMGRTKLYDMIQLEEFPAPIKLGRYSRWSQLEVQQWIEKKKNERQSGGAQ